MKCQNPKCGHPEESHEKRGAKYLGPCFYEQDLDCPCGKYRRYWKESQKEK